MVYFFFFELHIRHTEIVKCVFFELKVLENQFYKNLSSRKNVLLYKIVDRTYKKLGDR